MRRALLLVRIAWIGNESQGRLWMGVPGAGIFHPCTKREVRTHWAQGRREPGGRGREGGVAGQKGNRKGDKQTFETSLNPCQGKPHYRKTSSPTIPAESRPRTPLVDTASEQV